MIRFYVECLSKRREKMFEEKKVTLAISVPVPVCADVNTLTMLPGCSRLVVWGTSLSNYQLLQ